MARLAWLTPDSEPGYVTRSLRIPAHLLIHVGGALGYLTDASNWEEFGNLTPEETAQQCLTILEGFYMSADLGMVAGFLGNVPDGWLPATGQSLSRVDYPALWDALPEWQTTTPAEAVVLPDLRGLFLVGAGDAYWTGDTGGADTVTLTTDELPAHGHLAHEHGPNLDVEPPVGVPDVAASIGAPVNTGSTGGNQPHENRPPFMALLWCVKVE